MPGTFSLLHSEALLHISGPDSLSFLQGQTTCDTRRLQPDNALPGACCTPKGRVVCDFLLSRLGDGHYALRMRRDIIDHAAAVFGKYIVFSRASLDVERDDWQVFACWGPGAAGVLKKLLGQIPDTRFGAAAGDGAVAVQLDAAGEQFECYVDTGARPRFAGELAGHMATGEEAAWMALQIDAGLGRVEAPTIEQFTPQMLNFDVTGHISFSKGCYTGQEVVARLHYRGKPKRRMYLANFHGRVAPRAGTGLYTPGSEQVVGSVVNAVVRGDGSGLALVVAPAADRGDELRLDAQDGPALEIRELPYQPADA